MILKLGLLKLAMKQEVLLFRKQSNLPGLKKGLRMINPLRPISIQESQSSLQNQASTPIHQRTPTANAVFIV